MSGRTALISGATGLVGGHCLQRLLEQDEYERVVALTRRDLGVRHDKLEPLDVDFDRLKAHRQELVADDVFCCLGSTIRKAGSRRRFREIDYGYNLAVAQGAQLGGANQFLLVSSVGASPKSRTFYLQVKGELEAAISVLPYRSHHVFRPSFLLGKRAESRPLDSVAGAFTRVGSLAMVGGLRRFRAVRAEAVAHAMVAAALEGKPGSHVYWQPEILSLSTRL
jgi:uncharacterized protein YbjT (DUF2867 family)